MLEDSLAEHPRGGPEVRPVGDVDLAGDGVAHGGEVEEFVPLVGPFEQERPATEGKFTSSPIPAGCSLSILV